MKPDKDKDLNDLKNKNNESSNSAQHEHNDLDRAEQAEHAQRARVPKYSKQPVRPRRLRKPKTIHVDAKMQHTLNLLRRMGELLEKNNVISKDSMVVEVGNDPRTHKPVAVVGLLMPTGTYSLHLHVHPEECMGVPFSNAFVLSLMDQYFDAYLNNLQDFAMDTLDNDQYVDKKTIADLMYVMQIMVRFIASERDNQDNLSIVCDNRYDGFIRSQMVLDLACSDNVDEETDETMQNTYQRLPENVLGAIFLLGQIIGHTDDPQPEGINMLLNMDTLKLPKISLKRKDKYGRPIVKYDDCNSHALVK